MKEGKSNKKTSNPKRKVVCIIQARLGSTRLPNKVLLKVCDKEILLHVIERVSRSKEIGCIVIATTKQPGDKKIEELVIGLKDPKVKCFRGSEEDVLDRYYQAAKAYEADIIVRITADCPLIDWTVIDKVVRAFSSGKYDYVSNVLGRRTYPRGLDTECFSFDVLEKMWNICKDKREREHVTTYIRENTPIFKTKNILNSTDLSSLRWTLDETDDLILINTIYDELYKSNPQFNTDDIIALLKKKPELSKINIHVEQKKNIKNEAN
jgi:spore coat polysaccharide biosynthesis protein SpsF